MPDAAVLRTRPGFGDGIWIGGGAWVLLLLGVLFIVLPVGSLLQRSLWTADGAWLGLSLFAQYLETPALLDSAWRSLRLSARSRMPGWQARLFIYLARNAASASDYFRIPAGRVVEIGTQVNV